MYSNAQKRVGKRVDEMLEQKKGMAARTVDQQKLHKCVSFNQPSESEPTATTRKKSDTALHLNPQEEQKVKRAVPRQKMEERLKDAIGETALSMNCRRIIG